MKTPLPRWVWPLAIGLLALFVLSGVQFVSQSLNATKTHSAPERIILIVGLILGVVFVGLFQLRGWNQGAFFGRRVMRWIILFPILLVVVFSLLAYMQRQIKSAPEFQLSQDFLRGNEAVRKEYGDVKDLQMDQTGWSFQIRNQERAGTYQFHLKGERESGVISISWQTIDGKFMPLEIDNVKSDETANKVPIWTKDR